VIIYKFTQANLGAKKIARSRFQSPVKKKSHKLQHWRPTARSLCSIFHPGKFEQTITRQHVLLRQESLIDTVTIILCLHVLITYFMLFDLITLIGGDSCRDCM